MYFFLYSQKIRARKPSKASVSGRVETMKKVCKCSSSMVMIGMKALCRVLAHDLYIAVKYNESCKEEKVVGLESLRD